MSQPPVQKTGKVFNFPTPRRREDTALFETGPKTNKTVVVTDSAAEPLTDKTEAPAFTAIDKRAETLGSLEEMAFEAGMIVRDQGQPPGLKFFEILSGFAHERALDQNGKTTADPRDLGVGDIIGLTGFTSIVSKTVLTVRVYDLEKLSAGGDHELHILAMRKLLGASTNATTENRNAVVKTRQELLEATQANQAVTDQQRGLQKELEELRGLTQARLVALKNKAIRPFIKRANSLEADLNIAKQEIANLVAWLQTAFKLLPPQLEELRVLRNDREADAATIRMMTREAIDDIINGKNGEVIDKREQPLAQLICVISEALLMMSVAREPGHARKALESLNALFAFKMNRPRGTPKSEPPSPPTLT